MKLSFSPFDVSEYIENLRGAWVASRLTSVFGSGHDLTVGEFKLRMGSVLKARSLGSASDSVSPSLSTPPPLTCSLARSLSLSLSLSLFQK